MPPDRAFFVSQSASNLFRQKKNTLENFVEIKAPQPLLKVFATPQLLG